MGFYFLLFLLLLDRIFCYQWAREVGFNDGEIYSTLMNGVNLIGIYPFGNLFISGGMEGEFGSGENLFLGKMDINGKQLLYKGDLYNEMENFYAYDFAILPDESLVIVGGDDYGSGGGWVAIVAHIHSDGSLLGHRILEPHGDVVLKGVEYVEEDDSFVIVGYDKLCVGRRIEDEIMGCPHERDMLVMKMNKTLGKVWSKNYFMIDSETEDIGLTVIHDDTDGNIFLCGYGNTHAGSPNFNISISKLNYTDGSVIYSFEFGTPGNDVLKHTCKLSDGSIGFVSASDHSYLDDSTGFFGRVKFNEVWSGQELLSVEASLVYGKSIHMGDLSMWPERCVGGFNETMYVVGSEMESARGRRSEFYGFSYAGSNGYLMGFESDGTTMFGKIYEPLIEGMGIAFDKNSGDVYISGRGDWQYWNPTYIARVNPLNGSICPILDRQMYDNDMGIYEEIPFGGSLRRSNLSSDVFDYGFRFDSQLQLFCDDISSNSAISEEFRYCYNCYGEWNQDYETCNKMNGGGRCVGDDTCVCNEGYDIEPDCSITSCGGFLSNSTDPDICHSHGWCIGYDDCMCFSGDYTGDDCEKTYCSGTRSDLNDSCSGHGVCWPYDVCTCEDQYYGDICDVTWCDGMMSNDTSVSHLICSGRGTCIALEVCECEFNLDGYRYCVGCGAGWFTPSNSEQCNITVCEGIFSNQTDEVCNFANGTCVGPNYCKCIPAGRFTGSNCDECKDGWHGIDCLIPTCHGILANYTDGVENSDGKQACNNEGKCTGINQCECYDEEKWSGEECTTFHCFKISNELSSVCNTKGECLSLDNCSCSDDYYGSDCKERVQQPVFTNSLKNVLEMPYFVLKSFFDSQKVNKMSSRFNCSFLIRNWDEFLRFNSSWCEFNFVTIEAGEEITFCDKLTINIIDLEKEKKGEADQGEDDRRAKKPKWELSDYELPENFVLEVASITPPEKVFYIEVLSYSETVGPIVQDDDEDGDEGQSQIWAAIAFPSFFVVLVVGTVVFFCFVYIVCFVVTIAVLVLVVCGGSITSYFLYIQKKSLSKFAELDNFDLLLNEQKMERNSSAPKVKINKDLFEIDFFKKVKIIELLGEGGSSAVVFKAEWSGRIVAFKCFKTRYICGSQSVFDEFEREASLMSSLTHPNIIQFFGCCLKEPRIGFVMEYCENGDLSVFLNKKNENKELFLFREKIRMMIEIAAAMSYLHTHKVIHRDLKLENVLLDGKLNCKVMDFGISRVFEQTKQAKTKGIGTSIYIAPEIVNGNLYNEKCDIFSYAILCHILYYEHQHPYGYETEYVEARVAQNPYFRPMFKPHGGYKDPIPIWLKGLISNMWDHDPEVRKTFHEIVEYIKEESKKNENITSSSPSMDLVKEMEKRGGNEDSVFIYMKLSSENESKAEQIYVIDRTYEGLMKVARERYPTPEFNPIKGLLFVDLEEMVTKEIKNDEDVKELVTSNCLVDVEEYDDRDKKISQLQEELKDEDVDFKSFKDTLEEHVKKIESLRDEIDPLRGNKVKVTKRVKELLSQIENESRKKLMDDLLEDF